MNCREFEPIINRLARGQLLEVLLRSELIAHTDICSLCATKLASQTAIANGVRATVESLGDRGASPHVEVAIRTVFRAWQTESATSAPRSMRKRVWWLVAAAAAVVLVVLSSVALRRETSRNPRVDVADSSIRSNTPTEPPKGGVKTATIPAIAGSARTSAPRPRLRRHAQRRDTPLEHETTTDFYLLREDDQHVPLESGQVVRVEVPLSLLASVESDKSADFADKFVKADVVIGQDGLARAIRFVR